MSRQRIWFGIAAKRFRQRIFGEQTSYVRGLIKIAKRQGMRGYVFSPLDLDWKKRQVRAWVLTRNGWRRAVRPFPSVVYDRVWGLGPAGQEAVLEAFGRLREDEGIPVFNPDFGDKMDVHEVLMQAPVLEGHLPQTELLTVEALEKLAETHRLLYIKPARGRQGKRICLAEKRGTRWVVTRRTSSGKVVKDHLAGAADIVSLCSDPTSAERTIVQQGLDLVRVGGGAVDLRAIVQRDRTGEWRLTGLGTRVGKKGGFVSNLHAGGHAMSVPSLLRRLHIKKSPARLRKAVRRLALQAATALSVAYPHLGEIGLDLGLDQRGHLWILEVNRQPGRALFSRAGLKKAWRMSRVRVVDYAHYLAESSGDRVIGE